MSGNAFATGLRVATNLESASGRCELRSEGVGMTGSHAPTETSSADAAIELGTVAIKPRATIVHRDASMYMPPRDFAKPRACRYAEDARGRGRLFVRDAQHRAVIPSRTCGAAEFFVLH
jgi:hypothetical protein